MVEKTDRGRKVELHRRKWIDEPYKRLGVREDSLISKGLPEKRKGWRQRNAAAREGESLLIGCFLPLSIPTYGTRSCHFPWPTS